MQLLFKYSCFMFFLCLSFCLKAQSQQQDIVYLKNGSVVKGTILLFKPQGLLKIEILGGSILVYPVADVLKIAKETVPNTSVKLIKRPNHRFSGQGITHRLSIENMLGRGTYGVVPGFGHHYQCNYHVHRLLGIGAGVGINTFIDLSFIPLYANLKGYFMKTTASLYYDLNIGYGFVLPSYHLNSQGGLYLRPALGVRFPSTRAAHLFLDFGFNVQFATAETMDWNNNISIYKYVFLRPSLRFGISF